MAATRGLKPLPFRGGVGVGQVWENASNGRESLDNPHPNPSPEGEGLSPAIYVKAPLSSE